MDSGLGASDCLHGGMARVAGTGPQRTNTVDLNCRRPATKDRCDEAVVVVGCDGCQSSRWGVVRTGHEFGGRGVGGPGGEAGVANGTGRRSLQGPAAPGLEDAWLVDVAEGASRDAGCVPVELLGEYLSLLADVAVHGRRPKRRELDAVGLLGRRAAEQGISAGRVVQLYLSAARRLRQELPMSSSGSASR